MENEEYYYRVRNLITTELQEMSVDVTKIPNIKEFLKDMQEKLDKESPMTYYVYCNEEDEVHNIVIDISFDLWYNSDKIEEN